MNDTARLQANIDRCARQHAIRELNDAFRRTHRGGAVVVTPGIARQGPGEVVALLKAIAQFTAFDDSNDPWGEHDFGALAFHGQRVLWKIDYFNRALSAGSDDPADPGVTARVLTVMLAEEY